MAFKYAWKKTEAGFGFVIILHFTFLSGSESTVFMDQITD